MVNICGYELPTKLQNFTQKKLNQSENIPKSFRGGLLFSETPCILLDDLDPSALSISNIHQQA